MARYTDLKFQQDPDGIFDLVIEGGDLAVLDGLESALLVSLFSDRRADESEIGDPMKRRGWIGDLVADDQRDRHGSGLWLFEQARLTDDVVVGLRTEAEQCVDWMQDAGLTTHATATVQAVPSRREARIVLTLNFLNGATSDYAYDLAAATQAGTITTHPRIGGG